MILGPFNLVEPPMILGPFNLQIGSISLPPLAQLLTPENLSLDVVGQPANTVKLFVQSSNPFSVVLLIDETPVDLSVFDRMVLKIGPSVNVDSDLNTGIDWSAGNGLITFDIGDYLTGSGSVETTLLAYRDGDLTPYVLWHPSLSAKLRIEKISYE